MKPAFRTPLCLFALFAVSFMIFCKLTEPKDIYASSNEQIVVDGNFYQTDRFSIEVTDFKTEKYLDSSEVKVFKVFLEIHNLQEHKRLWYHSFTPDLSDVSTTEFPSYVRDERGNSSTILPIRIGFDGQTIKREMLPLEPITDVILFGNWAPKSKKIKMILAGNQMTDNKGLIFNLQLP